MPDYSRIINLVQSSVWLIEETRGRVIADQFVSRLEAGAAGGSFLTEAELEENRQRAATYRVPMQPSGKSGRARDVAIIPLIGAILPRGDLMADMSGGGAVNLSRFMSEFERAANDESVGAILLEIDSPGGQIDLVTEAAQLIRAHRKAGRPIVALANTMAASAAYWLASAADEIVASPSATVGSIGVFQLHQNLENAAAMKGVKYTYIYEGPRKVEWHPFAEMDGKALGHFQQSVRAAYESFTADVAAYRGVPVRVVRADPEGSEEKSFGGGRAYRVAQLRQNKLIGAGGMIDRVATLRQTVARLQGVKRSRSATKAKLALM